jgi:hypothetical protein
MFPDPVKGNIGLSDIENDVFVADQIQIQAPPIWRTLLDLQEFFEG